MVSGVGVALDDLGISGVTKEFTIINNMDEQKAMVSNGKRLKVSLFEDMPTTTHEYWTGLDARITKHFGGDAWQEMFGSEMQQKRKAAVADLAEKEIKLKEEKESGLVAGVAAPKSRKRVR